MIQNEMKLLDCVLENVPLDKNTIIIGGLMPHNNYKIPDWANGIVMRRNDTIYVIDTGAGQEYRDRLKNAINQLTNDAKQIILINTHSHADHIMNNDIIHEFDSYEIKHYVHNKYPKRLDQEKLFMVYFTEIQRYYNYFTTPAYPYKIMSVLGSIFVPNKKAFKIIIKKIMKKFMPNRSKTKIMEILHEKDSMEKEFGGKIFRGWKIGEIELLESIGHSPDHLMIYDPKSKLLVAGDETFQIFPTWPDTKTSNIIKNLKAIIEASRNGEIEILMDSHHQFILRGAEYISSFCGSILASHFRLRDICLSLVKLNRQTINEIYKKICEISFHDHLLHNLICMEFPRTPVFLKTVIASILLQNGADFNEKTKKWCLN